MTCDRHTLILPTYNRADELKCNLLFQDAQGLKSRVLVLDSSRPEVKAANARSIAEVDLAVEHIEYDPAIHPFDKFADGARRLSTPFASLCADDDLLLLPGLDAALRALECDPEAVVAHGFYFLFGHLVDAADIDITTMLYASPSILDTTPAERLRTLMRSYQALTYGVFRTAALQEVYARVGMVGSLMFRELLSSALPALRGKVLRVPQFYMARAHATGDDADRQRWHPLEWFLRDADSLVSEYGAYRGILADYLRGLDPEYLRGCRLESVFDLIHAGYLMKHLPAAAQERAFAHELAGRGIDDYWGDPAIQQALIAEHNSEFAPAAVDRFPLTRRVAEFFPKGVIDTSTGEVAFWPVIAATPVRNYRFYSGFLDNQLSAILDIDAPMVKELVNHLDLYQRS